MVQKTTIHGFSVSYEDNAVEGMKYLRDDLDNNEARVFFDQARQKGSARFEDDHDHEYTLIHEGGGYVLVRRK